MAYTIVKSDGTVLTTVADGTINTTSTSVGLPGRNYAGYGQTVDTNFVHQIEHFAATTPPVNALKGQLWYNTNASTLYVCPTDGETNPANWLALTSTSSGGPTTFGSVTVTGNILCNNLNATNYSNANSATFSYLTVTVSANVVNGNITIGNVGTLTTQIITTGANGTGGTLTGTWLLTGGGTANSIAGTALYANTGNIVINNTGNTYGIRTDRYMYANGANVSFSGTYGDSNVQALLTTYTGNVSAGNLITTVITSGANSTAGTITGNWTLTAGSRLNATYADLAERFAADEEYDPGTVVELGGDQEITAVKYELSEDIFGVISNSAAYLMNAGAGTDKTHPPVAMSGRVQVKVTGTINKGDRLVSAGQGIARSAVAGEATAFNTIGRALAEKTTSDLGIVEAIVVIR